MGRKRKSSTAAVTSSLPKRRTRTTRLSGDPHDLAAVHDNPEALLRKEHRPALIPTPPKHEAQELEGGNTQDEAVTASKYTLSEVDKFQFATIMTQDSTLNINAKLDEIVNASATPHIAAILGTLQLNWQPHINTSRYTRHSSPQISPMTSVPPAGQQNNEMIAATGQQQQSSSEVEVVLSETGSVSAVLPKQISSEEHPAEEQITEEQSDVASTGNPPELTKPPGLHLLPSLSAESDQPSSKHHEAGVATLMRSLVSDQQAVSGTQHIVLPHNHNELTQDQPEIEVDDEAEGMDPADHAHTLHPDHGPRQDLNAVDWNLTHDQWSNEGRTCAIAEPSVRPAPSDAVTCAVPSETDSDPETVSTGRPAESDRGLGVHVHKEKSSENADASWTESVDLVTVKGSAAVDHAAPSDIERNSSDHSSLFGHD